jgi:superfamily I DNA and RNA helicase
MEVNVASPALAQDPRARALIEHLKGLEERLGIIGGVIYYDYPLFRDTDDVLYRSKVLLASRSHGIAIFEPAELPDRTYTEGTLEALDNQITQLHSIIYGKLLKSRMLRRSPQELIFKFVSLIVLTDVERREAVDVSNFESQIVFSYPGMNPPLRALQGETLSEDAWAELRSILEGAKGLVRPKDREVPVDQPGSKAAILRDLELEVANFDAEQRKAAISIVPGPQRIRGLAGSGKTIVLAMKAAHIHLSNPDAQILFTFHTKSLYDFIRRLITRFYRQFNDRDPDFETKLHVLHSWGGRTMPGVYFDAAIEAGVSPLRLTEAQNRGVPPFEYACSQLIRTGRVQQKYDYVLIDEAQDLPPSFLRLCFQLTKGGPLDRNVVWAYDELQTIMSARMGRPQDAFGVDANRVALIDLSRAEEQSGIAGAHDIVLHKCYRNPREILVSAHALGLGIYSEQMVQTLENKDHWQDLGYVVEEGGEKIGERTVILRPTENSPLSIGNTQRPDEIIQTHIAADIEAEVLWVVASIQELLAEGLRPDDIMVVALNDWNAKLYFASITEALREAGISTNNMLTSIYGSPHFSVEKEVTLSSVYKAKGNEAPVVFVVGIDGVFLERHLQTGRNRIFTAFTRAKAWLRVSGVGDRARFFTDELAKALEKMPRLEFINPDPETVARLQRDLSDRVSKLKKAKAQMEGLREQLGLGDEDWTDFVETLRERR